MQILAQARLKSRLICRIMLFIGTLLVYEMPTQAQPSTKDLQIYAIDVEGGQATLLVAPSGGSLLVDTGWPGNNGRDADRILAAMKEAGIAKIDKVLITHFHTDHVGGVPELVKRVQVGEFLDHGVNREDSDITRKDYAAYVKAIGNTPRRTVHPGDTIEIPGLSIVVLAADGEHITAVPGVKPTPNPYCASEPKWELDTTENPRSAGILVRFGKFSFLDLGDLTKPKEIDLVCPNNPIGTVSLYLVNHHGFNQSNSRPSSMRFIPAWPLWTTARTRLEAPRHGRPCMRARACWICGCCTPPKTPMPRTTAPKHSSRTQRAMATGIISR